MSNLSFVVYAGDGGDGPYAVPFDYLEKSHVAVKVDGVEVSFTWLTDASVALDATAPFGAAIEIRRTTPREPLVDFTDGSILTEADLDASALQQTYIAQEITDLVNNSVTLGDDGHFTAADRRIADLADPIATQDAATKAYVDQIEGFEPTMEAINAAAAAQNAQTAAEAAAASIGKPFSTADLSDAAVTEPKLADDAVTAGKIAAGAVGFAKLGADAANAQGARTISTDAPSGGVDGDVWYQVES